MTFLQMECFLNAAKFQSYSLAAANLYISPPTFSRQIQALENELNVVLFTRANNLMQLTPVGQQILPEIEALFQNFCSTSKFLKEIADNHSGRLRIGIQAGHNIDYRIRQSCQYIENLHPTASILVYHQTQKNSYSSLMNGSIDLLMALGHTIPPSSKLDSLLLYKDYMCIAVPADHRNANLLSISYEELDIYFSDLKLYCIDAAEFDVPMKPVDRNMTAGIAKQVIYLTGPHATPDTLGMIMDAGLGIAPVPSRNILCSNQKVKLIPLTLNPHQHKEAHLPLDSVEIRLFWLCQNTNPLHLEFVEYLKTLFTNESEVST